MDGLALPIPASRVVGRRGIERLGTSCQVRAHRRHIHLVSPDRLDLADEPDGTKITPPAGGAETAADAFEEILTGGS
jgi:hypothetical protein